MPEAPTYESDVIDSISDSPVDQGVMPLARRFCPAKNLLLPY